MRVSKNFIIEELVPKAVYRKYGDSSIWFFDINTINVLQFTRDFFGKRITVNNWHDGGVLEHRGFREPDYKPGGYLSQHRFGRAYDYNVEDMPVGDVYRAILDNQKEFLKAGLTTMEDISFTKTWVHNDTRNTGFFDRILIVKP